MSKVLSLTILLLLLTAGAARAQADLRSRAEPRPSTGAPEGLASNGLCGLSVVARPLCKERVGLSGSAGYGYTESIGRVNGAHHRLGGALGIGVVPLPWLALALRLDGRLDLHPADERGKDLTGTGDPRLFLRAGRQLGGGLSLGAEAVLWLPGAEAPSFEPKATSVDLKALLAYALPALPLSLLANVGVRLDQSAQSAPDLTRLRPGDRIALGLSDSHAMLIALGASGRVFTSAELFGELSLDLLVGGEAPPFSRSPLRATVGARKQIVPALSAEISATLSSQQRPSIDPLAPLVPIEPRFYLAFGLRYAFELHAPKVEAPPPIIEQQQQQQQQPQLPTTATVSGLLVDEQGAVLPDVRVVLRTGDLELETVTDGEGRYRFDGVPVGPATLESIATGFALQRWELDVQPNMAAVEKRALTAKGNIGTLRVLTRTFSSEPLAATLVVRDVRGRKAASGEANAQGLYELDLPPGEYVVTISAPGYRPHRREVRIERYGVAILNVDMHAEK